jgi:hypothetical protein
VLYVDDATDSGALRLHEPDGEVRVMLTVDAAQQGDLTLGDVDSIVKAQLGLADSDNTGFLDLRGQRATQIVTAESSDATAPNDGAVRIYGIHDDATAQVRGELLSDATTRSGSLILYDAAGNPTVILDGSTGVISKAGLNGFLIDYPNEPSKQIFYASLEGPEAGIYARGSAKLTNGRVEVSLPAHFTAVAKPMSITVQVTPNSAKTYGLAVVEKSPKGFVVQELADGRGDFTFDYVVYAARGDIPEFKPIRAKDKVVAKRVEPRPQRQTVRSAVIQEPKDEIDPMLQVPNTGEGAPDVAIAEESEPRVGADTGEATLTPNEQGDKIERDFVEDQVVSVSEEKQ